MQYGAVLRFPPLFLFFSRYGDHRDLHSFPTRRSSDLQDADLGGRQLLPPVRVAAVYRGIARGQERHQRSEEHTSELQSHSDLVCRLLLEKKNKEQVIDATEQQTHPGLYDQHTHLSDQA